MAKQKRRFGDRKDGVRVRGLDSMHVITPLITPNRVDNEAVMNETLDVTAINRYLEKKNAGDPEFKYTFFHVILAALAKTFVLRPKMNRFYVGPRLYDRNDITLSFTIKKKFVDDSGEALAIIKVDKESEESAIEQIHEKIRRIVYSVRKEDKKDETTDIMDKLVGYLPSVVLRGVVKTLRWLDFHGKYPSSLMKDDPYYSSAFISNLGSIKMHASYHHLANWGTNSFFMVIGEKKSRPFYQADGTVELRDTITFGLTIDERIADGLYFVNSIKIFRHLIANPELLDLPISTPVELEAKRKDA